MRGKRLIRNIIERRINKGKELILTLIELRVAFDTVNRRIIWKYLMELKVPTKLFGYKRKWMQKSN